jgi:hypothetical protein
VPSLKGAAKGLLRRLLPGDAPAARRKPAPGAKPKKVWRLTPGMTTGEWVDADTPASVPPKDSESPRESSVGWLTSSMDLLGGSQVIEDDGTEPAPLAEEKTLPLGTRVRKK